MGDMGAGGRKRAVGTRDRVMSYLVTVGEISDANGMASNVLADAVGYPGSSIAFAQLLSGMERSGLIEREIRGKRTYRITPSPAAAERAAAQAAAAAQAPPSVRPRRPVTAGMVPTRRGAQAAVGAVTAGSQRVAGAATGAEDFDYDELARRLLVQVVQRLAAAPAQDTRPAASRVAGPAGPAGTRPEDAELARTVASLEHKLASVRSRQRKLTEENARLREQLRAAQESLAHAEAQAHAGRSAGQLDSAEVSLLERLLSPLRDKGDRREGTSAG